MNAKELLTLTEAGLYCPAGDFYIDAWAPVERCIVTHAHSDHAQPGSKSYLTAAPGLGVLRSRLGDEADIETIEYGQQVRHNDVTVSLHPAGHVLGSAQVRIEHKGNVWVLSSDYKTAPDATCAPFELVPCNTFVTESTFALPIFRWRPSQEVFDEINAWWQSNKDAGKCSLIFGYALGKAQRILSALSPDIGPIYTHGAVENLVQQYRAAGVDLPATKHVGSTARGTIFSGSIVIAPPSAQNTPWMRQLGKVSTAFASGWVRIRGTRRRKSIDKGFVLSDHADWDALNEVVRATGAERILVTHGYSAEMVRWLRDNGYDASAIATKFEGELGEMQPAEADSGNGEMQPAEADSESGEMQPAADSDDDDGGAVPTEPAVAEGDPA
ncbi:MAG TPA: ligase-associated DNA damage response exonuclease [Planktothrix sp.]